MPAWGWGLGLVALLGCIAYWFAYYKAQRPSYRQSLKMIEDARDLWAASDDEADQSQEAWTLLQRVAYIHRYPIKVLPDNFLDCAEYLERVVIEEREDALEALTIPELTRDREKIWAIMVHINAATDVSCMNLDVDATIGSPHLMDCREALLALTDKYAIACDLTSDAESAAEDVRREIELLMTSKSAATAQAH